ncbi:hypothetical protein [Agromyces humatus]|uniref:Uncharacterized protein n=1 Tax=Agromyces humatus TaxID=279573 RepID=A0ABP4WTD9_9MICO|nr:hypothetical protein [Agromyces humatus]
MTLDTSSPEAATPPAAAPPPPAPPTGPTSPPRAKGLGVALTLAIIVSAIPVIVVPVVGAWLVATSFTQTQQALAAVDAGEQVTGDTGVDGAAGSSFPVELPWDVEVTGPAYVAMMSGFPANDEWVALTEADPNANVFEYEHSTTGCYVWHTNGSVGADVDVANGDRAASIALIESALSTTVDPSQVIDGSLDAGDGAGAFGTVDAVEVAFAGDGFAATAVARTFAGIGEGAMVYVECADDALRADTVATARDLLYIALVPAGEGLE